MARNYAYLLQVNALNNNNKFYEITEADNGEVSVRYGRVGGKEMTKDYGHSKSFYALKEEKERKGYEDRTALHSEIKVDTKAVAADLSYRPVDNQDVQDLLDLLIQTSRSFMQKNYTVSASEITEKMINEAQRDINELSRIALNGGQSSLYYFNDKLQELFTDVPRKMSKVADFLARTENDFDEIIAREQEMLNNVRGAIAQQKPQRDVQQSKDITVLEAYGLDIRPVTYDEEDQITTHLGRDYGGYAVENRYVKGFAVENHQTREAYEKYKKDNGMTGRDVRLFYHGSKVENFYSIIKTGLSLNPNATITGKMFGQGLYFAPESRKALNYMDVKGSRWNNGQRDTGYCAVYAVALGKCYQPNHILRSHFREKDLPKGCHSVFASKNNPHLPLKNDEYIVYNQNACTIKYLLEMAGHNVRNKEYKLDRDVLRSNIQDGFEALVKTPSGVRAELKLEVLSSSVQAEFSQKITNNYDIDRLFIDYNEKSDSISLEATTVNGDSITLLPDITKDDYAFLSREMKKAFAKSEVEWGNLMKTYAENENTRHSIWKHLENCQKGRD